MVKLIYTYRFWQGSGGGGERLGGEGEEFIYRWDNTLFWGGRPLLTRVISKNYLLAQPERL